MSGTRNKRELHEYSAGVEKKRLFDFMETLARKRFEYM